MYKPLPVRPEGGYKMEDLDHWQRVEELFHSALECEPNKRADFLAKAGVSDLNLLAEVQALIQAHEKSGSFLNSPNFSNGSAPSRSAGSGSMIGQSLSRFKVISLLGKGGMGEVYLAEDTKLGRKVAIKSLPTELLEDDQAKRRLMREARAAARLDHPNICAIYEIGEEDNHNFIVMQYIEGDTLSLRIKRNEVRLKESIDIAIQIAAALSSAHSNGIIHRDIKPQNIIVSNDGVVKVLDFGLVKALQQEKADEEERASQLLITEAGAILGTAAYMSPEQVKNGTLSPASDLFSLGALLYECVTSRPAFTGHSLMEICAQVIHVTPAPPSRFNPLVPPELDRIILKALSKDANDRYQSAMEILADLRKVREALEAEDQVRTQAVKPLPARSLAIPKINFRAMLRSKHLRTGLIILAVVAIALWAGSHFRFRSLHRPSPEAQNLYEMGKTALCDGSYYKSSKLLERVISMDNKFHLAHARLAEAWVELDYPDRAKDELLIATTLIPDRGALAETDRLYLDALGATVRRDFPAAVENFRRIAELADDSQKAIAYIELGRAYQKNEQPEQAMKSYIEAIKHDPQNAGAHLRLGILYGRKQELDKAKESFDNAETIYHDLSNLEGETEVLFQRGYLFNNLNKSAEARAPLEKALELAQATANKHQRIRILLQLSSLSLTEGATKQAQKLADEAIALAQSDNIESLAANGIIDVGNSHFVRGEFADAEKSFNQAIEFAERSKSRRSEARGRLSLGSLMTQRNRTDEALRSIEQALAFYQQGGYRQETSLALMLLARGNRQKGNYKVALEAFEQQLRISEEIGDQSNIAYAHSGIGLLLGYNQERYTEALDHFQASYEINNLLKANLASGHDLKNRGGLLAQVGRYEEARAALNQAAAIASSGTQYKELLASVYLLRARLELSEGNLAEAKKNSQQAIELAGSSFMDVAIEARYLRALSQALSGMDREGKTICEEGLRMATEIGNPRLISNGKLALANILLSTGDWKNAIALALDAQAGFAQQEAKDSEWRALLVAAQAADRAGDKTMAKTYATNAAIARSELQQRLGEDAFKTYLSRTDIKNYSARLEQILATN